MLERLLRYGPRPSTAPAALGRGAAHARGAAPRHDLAVVVEGDRHRAHLRARRAVRAHRARHRLRRASARSSTTARAAARAARSHDRVACSTTSSRRAALFEHAARRGRSRASRCGAGGRAALERGERALGLALSPRRDRLPASTRFARARPRSDRRRADDVRAGELRALPAQDLQRRLDRRRRARSRSRCSQMIQQHARARSPGGVLSAYKRQRRGHRGHARRRASCPTRRPASTRCTREPIAHRDEGRDAQPPDRDLAVPGRGDRLGRRDPRRRRDRPRRASRRPGSPASRVSNLRMPGLRAAVGGATTASPTRIASRARDHARRPARRAPRSTTSSAGPNLAGYFRTFEHAEGDGAGARLSQADHARRRPRQHPRRARRRSAAAGRARRSSCSAARRC